MSLWSKLINKGIDKHKGIFEVKQIRALNAVLVVATLICLLLAINAFLVGRIPNGYIQLIRAALLVVGYYISTRGKYFFGFLLAISTLVLSNIGFILFQEYDTGNGYSYIIFLVLAYYFLGSKKKILIYYSLIASLGLVNYYFESFKEELPLQGQLITYVSIVTILFFLLKLFHDENQAYSQELIKRQQEMETLNEELKSALESAEAKSVQLAIANTKMTSLQKQMVNTQKLKSLNSLSKGALERISNPLNFISAGVGALHVSYEELLDILDSYRKLQTLDQKDLPNAFLEIKQKEEEVVIDELVDDTAYLLKDLHVGINELTEFMNTLSIFTTRISVSNKLEFSIKKLINDLLDKLPEASKSRISVEISPKLNKAKIEPRSLQLALTELLKNALDYSDKEVILKVWDMGRKWAVSIKDFGQGISEKEQERVFDPFYTTNKSKQHKGLGLTLASYIITQHKGNLELQSTEKEGTTIYVTIPLY